MAASQAAAVGRVDTSPGAKARRPFRLTSGWITLILVGHGVYGLLLARSAALATIHAGITFAVGLWLAATSTMRRVAIVCAYMAGSEVLWRLAHAKLPWEFVKYAIVLLMLLALSRARRMPWDWAAIAYFALLIPSTLMSFLETDFEVARQQISFNLSGPLVLAISTWFFALVRPSRAELEQWFVAILAPVLSLALIAITKVASLTSVTFTDASNYQTSGGYGPNQVSTVLGFGFLLVVVLVLILEEQAQSRLVLTVIGLILAAQSALTFSRGGLFGAVGAILIAAPALIQGSRRRLALILGATVLVAFSGLVVIPRLNLFTSGALATRFSDTNPTGRDVLIRTELETFTEHPIFGSGPATLDEYGELMSSTHTEFTRLLAQHGIFGAFALVGMVLIALRSLSSQSTPGGRAISLALIAWSFLTMTHAAMRLAIAPMAFGMAAAVILVPRRAPSGEVGRESRPIVGTGRPSAAAAFR